MMQELTVLLPKGCISLFFTQWISSFPQSPSKSAVPHLYPNLMWHSYDVRCDSPISAFLFISQSYVYSQPLKLSQGCLATAAPDKFPEAVAESEIPVKMDSLQYLDTLPTRSMWMRKGEDWYGILKAKIEDITDGRKV